MAALPMAAKPSAASINVASNHGNLLGSPLIGTMSAAAATAPTGSPAPSTTPIAEETQLPQTPEARVQLFSPAAHSHLALYLAALHGSCITHNGLSGSFVPPLHHEKLLGWWKARLATSTVMLLLQPATGGSADLATATARASPTTTAPTASFSSSSSSSIKPVAGSDLVGAALMHNHPAETSPHVAVIDLLLVSSRFRGTDGARLLLEALESHAVLNGRTLLTAEAETDSAAAATYWRLGFTAAGRIPGFVVRPGSGERRDQVILYRDLTATPEAVSPL